MANGSGAEFDGNGSVQWQVVTVEDQNLKAKFLPHGPKGRRNQGSDTLHGDFFKIDLLVPTDHTRDAFLNQFSAGPVHRDGKEVIELYLRILQVDGQIQIHWTPGIVPPPPPTSS